MRHGPQMAACGAASAAGPAPASGAAAAIARKTTPSPAAHQPDENDTPLSSWPGHFAIWRISIVPVEAINAPFDAKAKSYDAQIFGNRIE